MLHLVAGKKGGGKSMLGVRMIVDELKHGKRFIVTNVALHLDKLHEYVTEQGEWWKPGNNGHVDVLNRVRLIDGEQVLKYWRYRGLDKDGKFVTLPPLQDNTGTWGWAKDKSGEPWICDLAPNPGPVLYVIDEIHLYFNSRSWATVGREMIWYQSQERKMGDDTIAITQYPDNVDKQFRVLAQDVTLITNLSMKKTFGFQGPRRFIHKTFQTWPIGNQEGEIGTFGLDVSGLCKLYDTSAGVGIFGKLEADTKRRQPKLKWWMAIIAFLLIACAALFGPRIFHSLFGRLARPSPVQQVATPAAQPRQAPITVSNAPPSEAEPPPRREIIAYGLGYGIDADGQRIQFVVWDDKLKLGFDRLGRCWRLTRPRATEKNEPTNYIPSRPLRIP